MLPVKNKSPAVHTSTHQRRPAVVQATRTKEQQGTIAHMELQSSAEVLCMHPDAVRRRREQIAWREQREAERRRAAQMAQLNVPWHQQPSTMVNCTSAADYRMLVEQARQEGRLLVAKMFTEDCYVCKSLYPKMRKIAADNPDVLWVKLNGSDPGLVDLFSSLGVTRVPLFHMVLNGQLVAELTASLSPEKLAAFRAELAANKPTKASTAANSNNISPGDIATAAAERATVEQTVAHAL